MTKTKWIGLATTLALVAGAAWYFASPYYTLSQMREAARADDAGALSAYVDYPALREDLKAELTAHMMAEAQKDGSAMGALGVALGSAMIAPVVDGMVSPAGVRAMLLSNRRKGAAAAEDANAPGQAANAPVKAAEDWIIERRSFSEFALRSKTRTQGTMIFSRHGLGWKLSGVDLPEPK